MNIAVVGTGYVGLVTGVCLSNLGNNVICADIDKKKISILKKGKSPIYEPGLSELLLKNINEKRIHFTSNLVDAISESEIIFIAVGTPPGKNGEADLSAVKSVAKTIGENLDSYKIIINKSTVPVGSGDMVKNIINKYNKSKVDFDVVSNPEFLREGSAIDDFMSPDRVVIGSDNENAGKIIKKLYKPLEAEILLTDVKSAEIIKYASNAFLATKISFINEMANFCSKVGASIDMVSKGMGLDKRIGPKFLNAGIGYGGSCFPKDTYAIFNTGLKYGYNFDIIESVIEVNKKQRKLFLNQVLKNLPENSKSVAVWGLSFKPDTDDMREAPSIDIINGLLKKKISVFAYDPVAINEAKTHFNNNIKYMNSEYESLKNCDALIILTEWNQFKQADLNKVMNMLKNPVIFDGRNIYDKALMNEIGFKYYCIGE